MATWAQFELGTLCELQAGSAFPRSEQGEGEGELPFVKVSDMNLAENSQRIISANNWISRDTAKRIKAKAVPKDATVFAKIGEALKAERLRLVVRDTVIDNNMMAAIPNAQTDPRFLRYLLEFIHLANWAEGSALPYLRSNDLKKISVSVPSLAEQRAIGETIGALDNKIESNQRIVPVILRLIRAYVERYLSLGSEELPVSSLATFVNGGAFTRGASGTGRMVLRIAELNKGPGPSTIYNDIDVPSEKLARPGDILMSWSGSLGIYRWTRAEAIINQHIFKVLPKALPSWFVFDRVDAAMPVFQAMAADRATTMGHIQKGQLDTTSVPVPLAKYTQVMDVEMSPLWDRLLIAEREIHLLEEMRQVLLTDLLSGRVRVREFAA